MSDTITIVILVAILIPVVVYLSAKLGTYGYLKGKQRFEEDHHTQEKEND